MDTIHEGIVLAQEGVRECQKDVMTRIEAIQRAMTELDAGLWVFEPYGCHAGTVRESCRSELVALLRAAHLDEDAEARRFAALARRKVGA